MPGPPETYTRPPLSGHQDDELNAIRKQGRDAFLQASEDGSLEQAPPGGSCSTASVEAMSAPDRSFICNLLPRAEPQRPRNEKERTCTDPSPPSQGYGAYGLVSLSLRRRPVLAFHQWQQASTNPARKNPAAVVVVE